MFLPIHPAQTKTDIETGIGKQPSHRQIEARLSVMPVVLETPTKNSVLSSERDLCTQDIGQSQIVETEIAG
jgi:hypothetical protein